MNYDYSEFKKTYSYMIKTYKNTSEFFHRDRDIFTGEIIGTCTVVNYAKNDAGRWYETEQKTEDITRYNYCNIFDAVYMFKRFGGSERVEKQYTKYGYIPFKVTSISPGAEFKTVRTVKFN